MAGVRDRVGKKERNIYIRKKERERERKKERKTNIRSEKRRTRERGL